MNYLIHENQLKQCFTECEINGERVTYDACSTSDIVTAKEYYKEHFNYIGSGHKAWFDGVENIMEKEYHFFIKKNKSINF